MLIEIVFLIVSMIVLSFCVWVVIYLGKQVVLGKIYEFKAKRYIKKKHPKYNIDFLCHEVFEDSVMCELYNNKETLFGSLRFENKKIMDELIPMF